MCVQCPEMPRFIRHGFLRAAQLQATERRSQAEQRCYIPEIATSYNWELRCPWGTPSELLLSSKTTMEVNFIGINGGFLPLSGRRGTIRARRRGGGGWKESSGGSG